MNDDEKIQNAREGSVDHAATAVLAHGGKSAAANA
jgi:hypothetical protein